MAGSRFVPAPERRFCVTAAGPRSWADFLADVARARAAVSDHDTICNMAEERYDFAVLLAAAMINGQTTILPPSQADRAVEAAVRGSASPLMFAQLNQLGLRPAAARAEHGADFKTLAAQLQASQGPVLVFTSGSTGEPIRHPKRWSVLAAGSRLSAELIARAGLDIRHCAVIGTTPHQHMYGLEATMFSGLAHGCCLYDTPVFYPADIEAAAALGFDDLVLVTSPPHLKFLEKAIRRTPRIRCVISATAPLHAEMASRLEEGSDRKVFEIYGCTEAGSLAWRRTVEDALWTPLDGFRVYAEGNRWIADAPHLEQPAELADELETCADGRFRLLGRRGDMVSIAGKRQSLGALNAVLATMPGIRDGVVIRQTVDGEDRLSLAVVPEDPAAVDAAALRQALRAHMRAHFDPVFVPRAITIIDSLPRGATGKISARDLAALAAQVATPRA